MAKAAAEPEQLIIKEAVDRALHGDANAWEALYLRIRPRLFAFSMRRLGNRDDAEDAVAETMLRAVRAASTFHWRDAGFDAQIWIAVPALNRDGRRRLQSCTVYRVAGLAFIDTFRNSLAHSCDAAAKASAKIKK